MGMPSIDPFVWTAIKVPMSSLSDPAGQTWD